MGKVYPTSHTGKTCLKGQQKRNKGRYIFKPSSNFIPTKEYAHFHYNLLRNIKPTYHMPHLTFLSSFIAILLENKTQVQSKAAKLSLNKACVYNFLDLIYKL